MSVVFSLFVELAAALCALDHFYLLDNNQYSVELLTENGAFFKVAQNTFLNYKRLCPSVCLSVCHVMSCYLIIVDLNI